MWKLMLLAALIAIPRSSRASESCLWLNEATAAGILGGSVTSQVLHPTKGMAPTGTANAKSSAGPMNANPSGPNYVTMSTDDQDCTFGRRAGAISSEIRIDVRTVSLVHMEFTARLASCGNNKVALRAIGNEAVACSANPEAQNVPQLVSEQVIGRVRDRVFVVCATSSDSAGNRPALRESAAAAAKIVAGNLF